MKPTEKPSDNSLRLGAAGDVALGGVLEGVDPVPLAAEVRSFFAESDLNFVDLDCTLDSKGRPPNPQEYLVAASPRQLDLLTQLQIHLVSQANNHSIDYGGSSLAATQAHLQAAGIGWVGAGADLESARRPLILERQGLRVGFLGYASTHPWVGALPAGEGRPGVAPLEPELMRADIQALSRQVDCVVVSVHWGKEFIPYPPPQNVQLGHCLIDWGARLVLGHHPHIIQGIEGYRDGIICYSLGNFLFPDYPDQGLAFEGTGRESLLVRFRITRAGAALEQVVPVCLAPEGRLARLRGGREEAVHLALLGYSAALRQPEYRAFWQGQVRRAEVRRLWRVFGQEVVQAGWRRGAARLLRLGRKNFQSVGRSLREILLGTGRQV